MKRAILLNDTSANDHIGCRLVVAQILKCAARSNIRIVATCGVGVDWRSQPQVVDQIEASDLVLVNGEGTLHHSKTTARSLAAVAPFCAERDIPAVLLNTVFEENDEAMVGDCSHFSKIYVRESESWQNARQAGLDTDVVPDMTLSSDVMSGRRTLEKPSHNIYTDNANTRETEALVLAAIDDIHARFMGLSMKNDGNPFLSRDFEVPTRLASRSPKRRGVKTLAGDIRSAAVSMRWRHFGALRDFARSRHAETILHAMANARMVAAGRFHAACLSLMAGAPVFAFASNTCKTRGMMSDSGLERFFVPSGNGAHIDARRWKDRHHDLSSAYVGRAKLQIKGMFEEIGAL